EQTALKRGCLRKGGVADIDRACALVLDDFRGGRLGRISLDRADAERVSPETANADGGSSND
ncbi:MAG: hypothetical protein J6X19_03265, partial [Clostridia bacterium]|nr:hypothetical protein [Clostridia bacterium]